eukprot:4190268-Amphidinium_carterae.1
MHHLHPVCPGLPDMVPVSNHSSSCTKKHLWYLHSTISYTCTIAVLVLSVSTCFGKTLASRASEEGQSAIVLQLVCRNAGRPCPSGIQTDHHQVWALRHKLGCSRDCPKNEFDPCLEHDEGRKM